MFIAISGYPIHVELFYEVFLCVRFYLTFLFDRGSYAIVTGGRDGRLDEVSGRALGTFVLSYRRVPKVYACPVVERAVALNGKPTSVAYIVPPRAPPCRSIRQLPHVLSVFMSLSRA